MRKTPSVFVFYPSLVGTSIKPRGLGQDFNQYFLLVFLPFIVFTATLVLQ